MSIAKVQYLNPPGACPPQGLYSHVGRIGSGPVLFVAGQVAVDSAGAVVGKNDFEAQFQQVFDNLGAVLKGVQAGFDDYVRELRRRYAKVVIRKPAASRKRSPEVYALAQGKLAQMK